MTQPPLPFQPHSRTSAAAAESMLMHAATLKAKVYRYIHHCGLRGATDEEVQDALGMNPNTQRPRRVELECDGLVRDSKTTRRTRSGRWAVVWVAK